MVEINDFDFVHAVFQIRFGVKLAFGVLTDAQEIGKQRSIDCFRWMGHQNPSFESRLADEVRHGSAVVQMEMRDQCQIHGRHFGMVEKRQRSQSLVSWMDSTIKHDMFASKKAFSREKGKGKRPVGKKNAGTTDFLSSA